MRQEVGVFPERGTCPAPPPPAWMVEPHTMCQAVCQALDIILLLSYGALTSPGELGAPFSFDTEENQAPENEATFFGWCLLRTETWICWIPKPTFTGFAAGWKKDLERGQRLPLLPRTNTFLGAALWPCKSFTYSFPWTDTLWGSVSDGDCSHHRAPTRCVCNFTLCVPSPQPHLSGVLQALGPIPLLMPACQANAGNAVGVQ